MFDLQFKQSLDKVDEARDVVSLLDIADYKNGLAMQKFRPIAGDKGLPVLKIRELGQESCEGDAERCRSDIDESVTVHDGDLVFSWSGTLLLKFWAGGDAGLNQHLFKVTSETYPSWFYYAWTKHHLARFIMLAKDRATTMGHIKRSALEESAVLLPPKEELATQTERMQPIIDQMIANKVENRKLAALRDTLLPKLMSGEIDVSKVDLTQLNSHLSEWLRCSCFLLLASCFLLSDRYTVRLIALPCALDMPRQVFRLCRLPILSSRFGFRPGRILLRCLSFGR